MVAVVERKGGSSDEWKVREGRYWLEGIRRRCSSAGSDRDRRTGSVTPPPAPPPLLLLVLPLAVGCRMASWREPARSLAAAAAAALLLLLLWCE